MTNQSTPPASEWQTDQVIVFDWYDGARAGVCRFSRPNVDVSFELLEERATNDDLDDRLYYLQLLPRGSVDELADALVPRCGPIRSPIWIPQWPTEPVERAALEKAVRKTLSNAEEMGVILLTRDFQTIHERWDGQERRNVEDWFEYLGV